MIYVLYMSVLCHSVKPLCHSNTKTHGLRFQQANDAQDPNLCGLIFGGLRCKGQLGKPVNVSKMWWFILGLAWLTILKSMCIYIYNYTHHCTYTYITVHCIALHLHLHLYLHLHDITLPIYKYIILYICSICSLFIASTLLEGP